MKSERPINLSLTQFSFPLTAIASITHRITGVLLFAGAGLLLYVLDLALESPAGLAAARDFLGLPWVQLVMWAVLTALAYHFIAGVKHLLLDFHIGDTLEAARLGSQITIVLTVIVAVLAGAWIW